jgi:D-glycero-D-manno-heptose 1,7-bisphosphate phosphatase
MILQAQRELDIDLQGSILIGDKPSDIQAGLAAGVGTNILVQAVAGKTSPGAGDYLQIRALNEALPLLASHHQRCSQ